MKKSCPNCSEKISEGTTICPYCGKKVDDSGSIGFWIFIFGALLLTAGVFLRPNIEADFWRITVIILRWIGAIIGGLLVLFVSTWVISDLVEKIGNPLPRLMSKKDVTGIIKIMEGNRKNLQIAAANALGKLGGEDAVHALVRVIRESSSDDLRACAIEALEQATKTTIGAQLLDTIIPALKDSSFIVRETATKVLGRLGDPRAIEPLVAALKYKDIRSQVAKSLKKLKYQGDIEQVFQELKASEKTQIGKCAKCGSPIVTGLKEQINDLGVSPKNETGMSFGGFCSNCKKHYCWGCADTFAETVIVPAMRASLPGAAGAVVILNSKGMMYCPGCGKVGEARTLKAR